VASLVEGKEKRDGPPKASLVEDIRDGCQLGIRFFFLFSFLRPHFSHKQKYMKHSYFKIKEKNIPSYDEVLVLSSNTYFTIFLSLSILLTGLLFTTAERIGTIQIVESTAPNPHAELEGNVRSVVSGYPIEKMAPYIATHNKTSAAFLIAIAKKESNWGKRIPVDENGKDCYNYWGFKGAGSRGVEMGHGCFGSPREAIRIVGKRIDTMVNEYKFDTPEKFIVWKCGWNCKDHSDESVKKWISDVSIYFDKVNKTYN